MIINNPIFNMDMPDPDVLRVGDTYYMVSTTMFLMPGAPILKSKDLKHWELVSYVFDTIVDHENYRLENGKHAYGKGQWATSLTHYGDKFYACFVCHDMGKTFIYSTDDIEKSNWNRIEMNEVFHDMSFLFWEGKPYLIYDNGDIKIVELKQDLTGVQEDGLRKLLFEAPRESIMLRCEGCRALVHEGMIYLFFIEWATGGVRREVCYRSSNLEGPYERKIILEDTCGREGRGIAQGTLIDDEKGNWYAMMFQDRGASGRIPYLMPAKWEAGWPVIGVLEEGKYVVPETMEVPFQEYEAKSLIDCSFQGETGGLNKAWQWNHNPLPGCYEVVDEGRGISLTTGHIATGLMDARNTLTTHTVEPGCTCTIQMDYDGMKVGDYAGVAAFQGKYGQLGVCRDVDGFLLQYREKKCESFGVGKIVPDGEAEFITWETPIEEKKNGKIWFQITFSYSATKDTAIFAYSYDGDNWHTVGEPMDLIFTLDMFIGYRFALFAYATKACGGKVIFENCKIEL